MNEIFIINKTVIDATKNCHKSFACLTGNKTCMGKVVFSVNCKLHGILCNTYESCTYRYDAEERTFCTCPTRKEIYAKYKI